MKDFKTRDLICPSMTCRKNYWEIACFHVQKMAGKSWSRSQFRRSRFRYLSNSNFKRSRSYRDSLLFGTLRMQDGNANEKVT